MGLIPVCVKFAVYDAILGLLPGALIQFGVHGTIFRNASMARPGGRRLDQVIDEQDRRMGNEAFGLAPYNGRLVEWFSHHVILGLYVFLIAMPLTAFVIGCAIVLRSWSSDAAFRQATLESFTMVRAHLASLLIAGAESANQRTTSSTIRG